MRTILVLVLACVPALLYARDIEVETRNCVANASAPAAIITCEQVAQEHWSQKLDKVRIELRARLGGEQLQAFDRADQNWQRQHQLDVRLLEQLLGTANGLARLGLEGEKTVLIRQRVKQIERTLSLLPRGPASRAR